MHTGIVSCKIVDMIYPLSSCYTAKRDTPYKRGTVEPIIMCDIKQASPYPKEESDEKKVA